MYPPLPSEKWRGISIRRGGGRSTKAIETAKNIFPYFIDPVNDSCYLFCFLMTREGKSMNEERALAYANKVYRTMKVEPLAKSSVETRRIRDVFFEKR